jgi:uncharacterized membrane protein YhhN
MLNFWFILALVFAILQWYARWQRVQWLHYLTKPATMLALMVWYWQVCGWEGVRIWFALGLVFSLLGDVLLMLPSSFFLAGLAAFLTAHVLYIRGFWSGEWLSVPVLWGFATAVAVGATWAVRFFLKALRQKSYSRRIQIPVVAYIIVIAIMLFSAMTTLSRPAWLLSSAALVSVGALCFSFSDGLLAYDRFVNKIRHAHVWVMMSYHAAQIFILLGVVSCFSGE